MGSPSESCCGVFSSSAWVCFAAAVFGLKREMTCSDFAICAYEKRQYHNFRDTDFDRMPSAIRMFLNERRG